MLIPRLTVDLAAVVHNVARLRAGSTARDLFAVVKADAFGHGARAVAQAAVRAGATGVGVTSLAEAAPLQGLGVPVLSWLNAVGAAFDDPSTAEVEVAVTSLEHLDAVVRGAACTRTRRRVHLFLDTGMNRDGCDPVDWVTLCARARAAERTGHLRVVGVMGHLACADDETDAHHRAGRLRFTAAVRVARGLGLAPQHLHLSGTGATLRTPGAHHDTLRVGAGLVGIDPTRVGESDAGLRPAATLSGPVVQVRRVLAGQHVGYGHEHVVERDGWVGLVPLGYADGLPRAASEGGEMWVAGRRRRVLGWISMDQSVVDLGDDAVVPGTEAVVFGPGDRGEPTLHEWAGWGRTIPHEVVTRISARVARVHVGAERGWECAA